MRWSDSTISEVFDEADQLYGSRYGHTLSARIYTDLGATAASLSEPTVMQCAIFTASIAQFRRLMTFSAPPTVVIGHSLGEYAAYVAAGVLSFADGLTGVMARAETVSELPRDRRGTMLAVRIRTEEEDRTYRRLLLLASTSGDIGEAIANSSTQRVVSGAEEPIAAFSRTAEAHHLSVTRLRVTHAYHSPVLRPCVAPLRARLEQLTFHAPSMTVLSSITGETLDQSKDPGLAGLLAAQLVQPFDFGALLTKAADWGVKDFVEAGPGGVLSGIIESEKGETSCIPMDSRRRPAAEDERRVRLYLTSLGIPGLAAKPPLAAAKTTAEAVTDLVSTVTGYPRYAIPGGTPLERLGLVPALRQQLSTRLQTEYGPDFGDLSWSINRLAARLGGGGNYETSHPTPPDEAEPRVCCAEGAGASPLPGGTSIDAPATTSNQTDRLVQELITEFASATGYPTDVIEPNLDLEADLGIDSVKQAQVITTLATRHHIPQDTLDLTGAATITLIAQRLTQAHPNTNTQPDCPNHTATQNGTHPGTSADPPNPTPQLPHHDLATGLAQELITEFASATGYPTDVIEPNLDLEADLGIDSVKQAQVITTLATRHHIPQDTLDLTGAATITLIAQRLTQAHPNTNNETTRPPNTQDQTTHPSAGSEEDDEVTAISTEETEPEIAMRYLPRAIVRDLEQSPHTPRDLRGLRLLLLPATNRDLTERTQNLLEAA
ncbi:MAG: acyltransferase domain-containing protein, partial [Propionibacteriaceae bacterium]|nr:acyltransferase domain-containing protein [Propionibacteriaceae bacterium]